MVQAMGRRKGAMAAWAKWELRARAELEPRREIQRLKMEKQGWSRQGGAWWMKMVALWLRRIAWAAMEEQGPVGAAPAQAAVQGGGTTMVGCR
ncbi:hypothetical protein ACFX1S_034207 [Malus domestica]